MGRSLLEWLRQRAAGGRGASTHAAALKPAPTWPVAFALAAVRDAARRVRESLLAFAFGWAENMVQAAIKAVPLGQSAGQRMLAALADDIPGRGRSARRPAATTSARPSRRCWPSCRRSTKPSTRGCSAPESTPATSHADASSSALHPIAQRTKKLPPLRVGVGGPVGSGKTTLVEMLCKAMRER